MPTTEDRQENYGFLLELVKTNEFTSKVDSSEINFRELYN